MRKILLGPPGTGKTTTLIKLVQQELESGVLPERIGYLAFTKKAATEAMQRACEKFGLSQEEFPYFRTIHSFCFRCVGASKNQIVSAGNYEEFGKAMKIEMSGYFNLEEGGSFGFKEGDRMLFMANLARVKMTPLAKQYSLDSDNLKYDEVERVARGFQEYKEANFLMDYNDLLFEFLERGDPPQLDVLFVDEAQDLSAIQWRVVEKIAQSVKKFVIAGDDDQAIFRWAGADVDHFINLKADNVEVLNQSYRVPRSVQAVSNNIIKGIRTRREKIWNPRDEEGCVKFHQDTSRVAFDPDKEYLVLFRNAFLGKAMRKTLEEKGVLFSFKGFPSLRQSLLEAVIYWQRLLKGQELTLDQVRRVYEYMTMNIGVKRGFKNLQTASPDQKFLLQDLVNNHGLLTTKIWHDALDKINYYDKQYMIKLLKNGVKLTDKPKIALSTIHGAKGGESENVILLSDMASRTYEDYQKRPEDESRVFYVAATRSKKNLHIITPQTSKHFPLQF